MRIDIGDSAYSNLAPFISMSARRRIRGMHLVRMQIQGVLLNNIFI